MNSLKVLLSMVIASQIIACASTSRERILQTMFVAGTVGALYGLSKDKDRNANAAMYGGLAAATAGAVGLMIDNPDTETKRLREEVAYLKNQREVQDMNRLVGQSPATFGGQVPEKYKHMVRPGEWRIYDLDVWVEDGENRLVHKDKVMELIPPSLVPRKSN